MPPRDGVRTVGHGVLIPPRIPTKPRGQAHALWTNRRAAQFSSWAAARCGSRASPKRRQVMRSPLQWTRQPSRNAQHRFTTASGRSRRPIPRLQVEGLESRCLLSVTINEFPILTTNSGPLGITTGPDGNLWFTETNGNPQHIGQINPTTHVVTEFPTPTAASTPVGITTGPDGNLWFAEAIGNQIGQL